MKQLTPRFLSLLAASLAILLLGHNTASASYAVTAPAFETQISLTDDSQLACHAFSPETTAEFF